MTKDEALKLALEYVELVPDDRYNAEHINREALVTSIKEALAQPEQEPVGPEPFGFFQYDIRLDAWVQNRINNKGVAFYTKEKK